jgi:osmotically-inducible protein OsmY
MNKPLLLLTLITHGLISACATTPIDEQSITAELAQGRRSREAIVRDKQIEADSYDELADDKDLMGQTHINVHAYNGAALVTGEAPRAELIEKVIGLIRVVDNVKLVHNKVALAQPSDLSSRAADAQLAGQITAALAQIRTLPNFNPAMIKVYTEHGVIYLMGRVHRNEGNVAINVVRYQPNVKQIITVFEYLD